MLDWPIFALADGARRCRLHPNRPPRSPPPRSPVTLFPALQLVERWWRFADDATGFNKPGDVFAKLMSPDPEKLDPTVAQDALDSSCWRRLQHSPRLRLHRPRLLMVTQRNWERKELPVPRVICDPA